MKCRNDSIEQYKSANRDDLVQIELDEISFYEPYLPQQLTDEELTTQLQNIIEQVGATTMKDMGKVMGMASKALSGRADGKRINECVKKLLS